MRQENKRWLYFAQFDIDCSRAPIKIGISKDCDRRWSASASPYPMRYLVKCPGGVDTLFECYWHYQFTHLRLRGEWFIAGDEILQAATRLTEQWERALLVCSTERRAYTWFCREWDRDLRKFAITYPYVYSAMRLIRKNHSDTPMSLGED